jgi:hypothetical protein
MKKWIVPNVIAIIIFSFIMAVTANKPTPYPGIVDAFMITGAFLWMGAGIVYINQEGAFDIVIYGVKRIVRIFKKYVDDDSPKSYYEYVDTRRGQKKIILYPTILVGTVYFLVGLIIFLI